MESPWRRVRCRGLCRPPKLLLIVWCLVSYTGVVNGADQPILCERNICKNDGKCYLMETAIPFDGKTPITSSSTAPETTAKPSSTMWSNTVPTEPASTAKAVSAPEDYTARTVNRAIRASDGIPTKVSPRLRTMKLWNLQEEEDDEEAEEEKKGLTARQLRSLTLEDGLSGQTCYCDGGYEGEDCSRAQGDDGTELTLCRDTKIGSLGSQIIVDFAMLGRLPWKIVNPQSGCPDPDEGPPDDSDGCSVPSGEAALRYWCQGKSECTPSIDFLTDLGPNSCTFEANNSLSMWLYLRYREDASNSVNQCRDGSTYDSGTLTCYIVTPTPSEWQDQRAICRQMGGDMLFHGNDTEFDTFLQKLVKDTGRNITELWAVDYATEVRPVANLTAEAYPANMDSCVPLTSSACSGSSRKYTVCALPPWPSEAAPDCPPVRFDEYDLTFPETAAGLTVNQSCGNGYTGSATYTCGLDGQWSSQYPDLSGCYSETINTNDAKNRLDNGTEPVSDIVSELATNVSQRTSQSQPLTSGDVISSVQLLPQMVATQQDQLSGQAHLDKEVVEQYLSNVTYLVNELTRQEVSWHAMPHVNRSLTSSTLQTNIEQSAYLLTHYLDDCYEDFNMETIRLRTGRYSSLAGNLEYTTQQGSTVTLPEEVGRFSQSGNTSIVFVEYGNMDCLLRSQQCRTPDEWHREKDLEYTSFVNSPLVSASVENDSVVFESSNVTLQFKTRLSASQFNITNVQCVFWNDSTSEWSTEGCHLGTVTNNSVDCYCDHLTSFATLMDINGIIEEGSPLDLVLGWLTNIGCVISLLSLAVCLVVFTAIPALRRDPSKDGFHQAQMSKRVAIHRNLCLCLFIAELILLAGLQPHGNATGCAIVAGLLHFFFLAAFAWMCIEGVDACIKFYYIRITIKDFYLYLLYACGYGIPALIVVISLSITKGEGYGTETACWLSAETGLIWAFAGPVLLLVTVNICALIMSVKKRYRDPKRDRILGRQEPSDTKPKGALLGSASLVFNLGTTWLFGFLYLNNGLVFFSVVFTILNSLQGFFIFLFLVWLDDKTRTETQRFFWKTTNRMGLTNHDLSSTSGGLTPRPRGGHAVDRTTSQPNTPGTGTGTARPHKTNGPTNARPQDNLIMRAISRVNGTHYSLKRMGDDANASTSVSHEVIRRLDSSHQPASSC